MGAEDIQGLVKSTLEEIEHMLTTKTVVGEPITVEGNIIVPLVAVGFGFGGGGMSGRRSEKGEGGGTGIGGAALVRPVAVIIVSKDGVRVEPAGGFIAPVTERFLDVVAKAIDKRWGKQAEDK